MLKVLILHTLALLAISANAYENNYNIVGYAFDNEQGELIYREVHKRQGQNHTVNYVKSIGNLDAEDNIFARKNIEYVGELHQPEIHFISSVCRESYKISRQGPEQLNMVFENQCNDKESSTTLTLDTPYVVDAGFDEFLKNKIIDLKPHDQTLTFYYPLPSLGSKVLLRASLVDCSSTFEIVKNDFKGLKLLDDLMSKPVANYKCVNIQPSNWFIARFAKPLTAVYQVNVQPVSLSVYRGKANFSNALGEYPQVTIFYRDQSEQQTYMF